jgi:hypothetical protein
LSENYSYDVVIIGGGLTGLYIKEKLSDKFDTCIISSTVLGKANDYTVGSLHLNSYVYERPNKLFETYLRKFGKVVKHSAKIGSLEFPTFLEDYAQLRLILGYEDETSPKDSAHRNFRERTQQRFGELFTDTWLYSFMAKKWGGLNPFEDLDGIELPLVQEELYRIDIDKYTRQIATQKILKDTVVEVHKPVDKIRGFVITQTGHKIFFKYLINTTDIRNLFMLEDINFNLLRQMQRRTVGVRFDKRLKTRFTTEFSNIDKKVTVVEYDGNTARFHYDYAPPLTGLPYYLNVDAKSWSRINNSLIVSAIPPESLVNTFDDAGFHTDGKIEDTALYDYPLTPIPLRKTKAEVVRIKKNLFSSSIFSVGKWGSFKPYSLVESLMDAENLCDILLGEGDNFHKELYFNGIDN